MFETKNLLNGLLEIRSLKGKEAVAVKM